MCIYFIFHFKYYLVDDNKESLKKDIKRPIVKLDENGGGYDE